MIDLLLKQNEATQLKILSLIQMKPTSILYFEANLNIKRATIRRYIDCINDDLRDFPSSSIPFLYESEGFLHIYTHTSNESVNLLNYLTALYIKQNPMYHILDHLLLSQRVSIYNFLIEHNLSYSYFMSLIRRINDYIKPTKVRIVTDTNELRFDGLPFRIVYLEYLMTRFFVTATQRPFMINHSTCITPIHGDSDIVTHRKHILHSYIVARNLEDLRLIDALNSTESQLNIHDSFSTLTFETYMVAVLGFDESVDTPTFPIYTAISEIFESVEEDFNTVMREIVTSLKINNINNQPKMIAFIKTSVALSLINHLLFCVDYDHLFVYTGFEAVPNLTTNAAARPHYQLINQRVQSLSINPILLGTLKAIESSLIDLYFALEHPTHYSSLYICIDIEYNRDFETLIKQQIMTFFRDNVCTFVVFPDTADYIIADHLVNLKPYQYYYFVHSYQTEHVLMDLLASIPRLILKIHHNQ